MLDDVRLLSAGFCLHPEFMSIRGGGWRPCRFPAGFAFIHHARHGPILFDTGYSDHFWNETRQWPYALYRLLLPPHLDSAQRARDQLRSFGVDPADVRMVVASHFHADHIAGLRDFPQAAILCARAEWNAMRANRGFGGLLKGFLPGLLPNDAEARVAFIEDRPAVKLPAALSSFGSGHDLLGDGSVMAVALPGHSAGQFGLYLPETKRGALFLVADAAWSLDAIERLAPPPRPVRAMLGNSPSYLTTLAKLHQIRRSSPALTLAPAHGHL